MSTEQLLALSLIFVAVAVAVWALGYLVLGSRSPLSGRLTQVSGGASLGEEKQSAWKTGLVAAMRPVAKLSTPESDEDVSRLRAKFLHAGIRQSSAPVVFFGAKTLLALSFPLVYMFLERYTGGQTQQTTWIFFTILLAGIGYYLPNAYVARRKFVRQRELFEAFPDAIDLMIVCVEAGLALDMAINRSAAEIRLRSPILADELDLVALDLRVGSSRERALTNLAARTGLEEISTFVAMLIQADRFGTSLAEALRVHADGLRTRRQQRAEEAAAKIALKLLFPLIFFIFPSMMLVLMGPAMIQIYRVLLPTMAGG